MSGVTASTRANPPNRRAQRLEAGERVARPGVAGAGGRAGEWARGPLGGDENGLKLW